MALAIFDLDNTLLAGDSDYLWGQFLCEQGVVNSEWYEARNAHFFEQYKQGQLDIREFLAFALDPLAKNDPVQLKEWRAQFIDEKIVPLISDQALELVEKHRAAGDTLVIITATNSFVTYPIADRLGIPNLIATEPERIEGHYTGRVSGIPSFREGKVERLRGWMDRNDETLEDSWFYSDSHNDLPLLELVSHPVAVDPDPELAATAEQRGWEVLRLHADALEIRHAEA